ncbi:hypothetical protein [Gordonia rhizosphera]|uniref:Uncharacterized protein n=1 Tax=Gordonia rhizosphera NBRC 16068 TaxID=1108045 RepID=K6V9T3_9ACTN|nr:hypothetical protein [Gordonia rhizosphera]GAB92973.1 hypothetical protein GORHZ_200_00090 [Gordonia rhizosphera NBRC 16068]
MAHAPTERRVVCGNVPVFLADSVSFLSEDDRGGYVVSASHGGISAAEHALIFAPAVISFNDAGGGKDDAGFRALDILDGHGISAFCVSHETARIGDALDHWENGVVSRANRCAESIGIRSGMTTFDAIAAAVSVPGQAAGVGR